MRIGINGSFIRANKRVIHIRIHILHITHFARINGFLIIPVFVLPKYMLDLNFSDPRICIRTSSEGTN